MEKLNRVIEIDVDTQRVPMTIVRNVKSSPHRNELIPHEPNLKEDMTVMIQGLLASILYGEKIGEFKKGEAMKRVVEMLEEGYVDVTAEVVSSKFDEHGNLIKSK